MKNIRLLVESSYSFLNKTVPLLLGTNNKLGHHNYLRLKKYKPDKNTFEGYMSCGATCHLLKWYLHQHNISPLIKKTSFGYGKYLEDHIFLQLDDIIIDPTYKQMFRTYSKPDDEYMEYLYNELPFVFINKIENINILYNDLNKVHIESYNTVLSDENLIFWQKPSDVSQSYDLDKIINNREYARKNGNIYLSVHEYITNNSKLFL